MKEPSEILILEKYTISIFEENDYRFDSTDNWYKYSKEYIKEDNNELTSVFGIKIFEDEKLISDCIIGSDGGATGIYMDSTMISYEGLVICCSDKVFKLSIPELNLEWKTKADTMTCFGIHSLDADYVVHGELEITRLNKDGKIIWQKRGRDIWTTPEGIDDFVVYDDYILATDWEYNRYKFDFNGNVFEEYKVKPRVEKAKKETPIMPINKKKWWEIWK
ncbi:hypothetical protein [Aquimarina agarivorans]|uniref:hypothetical protein n=1 Tax=Aquimarina agarivorans TaxID=980584 RepID=UPI000248E670|nr:hypothetical protein [Aquimarina agarivorans]